MKNFCLLILSLFIIKVAAGQSTCVDTNATYLDRSTGIVDYQDSYGGYILGSDSINIAVGDNFDVGQGQLQGVLIWFGSKALGPNGATDSLNVYVFNTSASDSLPTGGPIDSAKIAMTDIDTAFDNSPIDWTYVAFPHTPTVTTNYAIVVQTYYGAGTNTGDSVAIFGNNQGDGNGEERAIILAGNETWYHIADIWTIGGAIDDVDALMAPIVQQSFYVAPTTDQPKVCPGSLVNLNATAFSCSGIANYFWSGPGVNNPYDSATTATVPDGQTNSAVYTVTVIDNDNDTLSNSVTVTVENIIVSAGDDTTIPCGTTTTLSAVITGHTGAGTTIQWENGGPSSLNYPNVTAGTYTVSVTNSTGCSSTGTVTISIPDAQIANFAVHSTSSASGADTISATPCASAIDTFVNTSTSIDGWTWTWTYTGGGQGFQTNLITPSLTFSPDVASTITLTGDSSSCTASVTETITAEPSTYYKCASGISELNLANMVSVYPNPTTGLFNINFKGIESSNVNIKVYDLLGRDMMSVDNFSVNSDETKTLDLTKNANGIYFVRVQVDGSPYTVKINVDK